MGLEQGAQFSNYHRVLNRNIWSSRWLSRHLFRLLVDTFVPSGDPVVIGLDDTIERRWGGRSKHVASIETRSVSSHGHFGGQRSATLWPAFGRQLWTPRHLSGSRQMLDPTRIPSAQLNTLIDLACYKSS
jgi:DDE superfamily endonuclease